MAKQILSNLATTPTETFPCESLYVVASIAKNALRELGEGVVQKGSLLLWEQASNKVLLSGNLEGGPAHGFHDVFETAAKDDGECREAFVSDVFDVDPGRVSADSLYSESVIRSDQWVLSHLAELIIGIRHGIEGLTTDEGLRSGLVDSEVAMFAGRTWWRTGSNLVLRTRSNVFIASFACASSDRMAAAKVLSAIAGAVTTETESEHFSDYAYLTWLDSEITDDFIVEDLRMAYSRAETLAELGTYKIS